MLTTEAQRRAKTKWRLANPDKQRAAVAKCVAAKPDHYKAKADAWRAANRDKVKAMMARHDAKPHRKAQRGDYKARQRRYRERHLDQVRQCKREYQMRRLQDPMQRTIDALRRRIRMACYGVSRGPLAGLEYSAAQLRVHLEEFFKPGMTWANYGEWQIDHRRPVSSFALPDQMMECFALSNLQPLWESENLSKAAKWEG